ncbi:MAG: FAD-dependent oxidoreductase [Pseudorhodoplanes sp.]
MKKISRREVLTSGAAGLATLAWRNEVRAAAADGQGPVVLNDASRLNPTPVAKHVIVRPDDRERLVAELRALLAEASRSGDGVCLGGARHSMGGQSLLRNGIAVSLDKPHVEVDAARKICRVRAGARWRDVLGALDPLGLSVAVMQSNSDFSVGGTLCVNAHGWPVPCAPFGATVQSFRLMLADGAVLTCSRNENAELFGHAIGGYGLFGIVLDIDMTVVSNATMLPRYDIVPAGDVARRFLEAARDPQAAMAYGRLSVAREHFLEEGLVVSYRTDAAAGDRAPAARPSQAYSMVSRALFRAQIGSERGKKARWHAETRLLPPAARKHPITRNAILGYPVSVLAERRRNRTDILHEYFLPADRFADFLEACRARIPPSLDLLNVTLRYVDTDIDSTLSYAPAPRIAAVMLFNQPATQEADERMRRVTEPLIDAALSFGGSYYLPYRLHARPAQFRAAYPGFSQFAAAKRRYDPQLRFRNALWDVYLATA